MDKEQIDISDDSNTGPNAQQQPKKSKAKLWASLLGIVIIAVIAAGGWKWYGQVSEYQMKQNESDKQISALQAKLDELNADKSLKVDGGDKQIVVTYPAGWIPDTTSHETGLLDNNTTVEDATLTSQSGNTVIRIQTGVSGIGGACVAEDQPENVLDSYSASQLSKSKDYSYIQYYSNAAGVYGAHVVSSKSISGVKKGANICDVAFSQFMGVNDKQGIFMVTINSSELEDLSGDNTLPSAAQMQKFFDSGEYKEAKAIVQTAQITYK